MTLDYGNYGIFLIRGNAGFVSSTVRLRFEGLCLEGLGSGLRGESLGSSA